MENLHDLKQGQDKILDAFVIHKKEVDKQFVDLALKSAEAAGAAKVKARLWSIGGAAFTTIFAGSYEWLKHHFGWK